MIKSANFWLCDFRNVTRNEFAVYFFIGSRYMSIKCLDFIENRIRVYFLEFSSFLFLYMYVFGQIFPLNAEKFDRTDANREI